MMKAFERAKFVAETSTRQRRSAPVLRQIESQLTKNILAQSLALEIIRNSRKPTSELISEPMEIEVHVGEFVREALRQPEGKHRNPVDLRGALAGALSFIPIRPMRPRNEQKGVLRKLVWRALRGMLSDKGLHPEEAVCRPSKIQSNAETKPLVKTASRKFKRKK